MENNEKEYIITIDGTDCSGKSTLWKKANATNKNIQIRGILSNIAYGIKYNRDIDEMIDLYNENPVNYVVYLINPINDKKLEMLYNRLKEYNYDNDFIEKELLDASKTWKDYSYFEKAQDILSQKYKGEIIVKTVSDNNYDDFIDYIKQYKVKEINTVEFALYDGIKCIKSTIDDFEKAAKIISEFKYIVLIDRFSKEDAINNLYNGLDDKHQKMYDKLFEYTNIDIDDIYDSLYEHTPEALTEYLDDYELRVEVNVRCEVSTWTEVDVPLRDAIDNDCLEDAIYNDNCIMDDIYEAAKNDVYDEEVDIEVDRVR